MARQRMNPDQSETKGAWTENKCQVASRTVTADQLQYHREGPDMTREGCRSFVTHAPSASPCGISSDLWKEDLHPSAQVAESSGMEKLGRGMNGSKDNEWLAAAFI